MSMTTIYRVDSSKGSWACIVNELGLPSDTDQITVKYVCHITETDRKKKKEEQKCQQQQ